MLGFVKWEAKNCVKYGEDVCEGPGRQWIWGVGELHDEVLMNKGVKHNDLSTSHSAVRRQRESILSCGVSSPDRVGLDMYAVAT